MSFNALDRCVRQAASAGDTGGGSAAPHTQNSVGCEYALPVGVPLLFIDASSPLVQTGLWQDGRWLAHRAADAPALEEIFRSVSLLLEAAGLRFADIGGFIHNEGPGSILGIRLGAMALRVWAGDCALRHTQSGTAESAKTNDAVQCEHAAPLPVWAVRSLPLVAAKIALQNEAPERSAFAGASLPATGADASPAVGAPHAAVPAGCVGGVFSEFRQGLWNWFTPAADDVFGEGIEVIETEELAARIGSATGKVWHLRHRKSWEAPPGAVSLADSDLCACPQVLSLPGLLRRVALPEALLTRAPEFKTASGERHRGSGDGAAAGAGTLPSQSTPSGLSQS